MKVHPNVPVFTVFIFAAAVPACALAGSPNVGGLATHPQCYVAGDVVLVRGAVAVAEDGTPVPGARVRLAYGADARFATSNADGVYVAEFPRTSAHTVREVSTSLAAPTGTLIPVQALEGGGSCVVPTAHVGALREVDRGGR